MRTLLTLVALTCLSVPAFAADTTLAKNTRTKLLKAKITVDFKEEMLRDILDEIKGQLNDQGLPTLGVKFETGVSQNQRLTIKAENKPVEEILGEILAVNKLGFIVVSKSGDRYDGWIEIRRGDERGWPAGEEPKGEELAQATETDPEPEPKPMPEPMPEPEEEPATRPMRDKEQLLERIANQHYSLALTYMDANRNDKARTKFEFIIEVYPDTQAATAAKDHLQELK